MSDNDFVHLHVHTEYSLLDGLSRISKLVDRAKTLGMDSLAITDHGTMFGVIDFYNKCKDAGIKPIIGVEGYLAARTMFDRDPQHDREAYHLLLLAKNQTGYKNLLKIASASQLEGYYYRPRIDREFLAAHSEGLVATSGCLAAQIPSMIMQGRDAAARDLIDWYLQTFGKDSFFLELQEHSIPELKTVNDWLIENGKKDDVRYVATNDVHYVLEGDFDAHDTLLCIQSSAQKTDTKRMKMSDNSYYLSSKEEMWKAFGHINDGEPLKNTRLIAEMCEIDLDRKGYHLPIFPVPEGYTSGSFLRYLCDKGLAWRYGERAENEPTLRERLEYELDVIGSMGFETYFLIVWDLCEFARQADIWWNVRGSGAGSVAAYSLGITNVDPIQNSLLFERFLNPGRVSMPDIDLDYPDDRRTEMIAYTVQKYGEDKVAAIITFGTMGAKAAVRDVGRALGVDLSLVNRAARLIPTEPKPKPVHKYVEDNPELKDLYDKEPQIKTTIDTAASLQGVSRHASTHAAGIIVADKPLVEYIPLHRQTKGNSGELPLQQVTQFPMETCEEIGLLKIDFLGLSTLTYLRRACDLIEKHHGIRYSMDNIPYRPSGDEQQDRMLKETFEMIGRGETIGVFQIESTGMQQMLREMRPTKFEHIVAGVSLYRPGPMDYIPDYNARMHGEKKVEYHHPKLEPILAETYGILVFQEQIMRVGSDLFGYSLGDADLMRKAVSKKKKEDLLKHREIFLKNGPQNGVDKGIAGKIFDDIEFFANYGFNKCLTGDTEIVDAQTGRLMRIEDVASGKVNVVETVTLDTDTLKLKHEHIVGAMENGVKPVYRLTTRAGRTITATDNHPFYTYDGWRNLGELKPGDLVATPRRLNVQGKGYTGEYNLLSLMYSIIEHEMDDGSIPDAIFELTASQLDEFIGCAWSDGGGVDIESKNTYYIAASPRVAHQLQHLLLRRSVMSRVGYDGCCVIIEEPSSLREFFEAVCEIYDDIDDEETLEDLALITAPAYSLDTRNEHASREIGDIYWDEIASIEYAGEEMTYDLTIEGTHNFVANDIIVHNSHATDYAVITVQSAFLKCHYPHEYMAALLSVYFDDAYKVTTFLSECKRLNIPILPPDINYSALDFDIQKLPDGKRGVRFGMAAIKNAGVGALQHMINAREEGGAFASLEDLCQRVDLRLVGKRALESLVKVGALDGFGKRPQLIAGLDRIVNHSTSVHKAKETGQMGLFGETPATSDDLLQHLPNMEDVPQRQMLDWEKELMGIYISQHPIDPVLDQLSGANVSTSADLKEADPGMHEKPVRLVGLVSGLRKLPTRNHEMMAVVTLEDKLGMIDAVMFPRTWSKVQDTVVEGEVIIVMGKLDLSRGDAQIICENVTQQFETIIAEGLPSFTSFAHDAPPSWLDPAVTAEYERVPVQENGTNGWTPSTHMPEPPPFDDLPPVEWDTAIADFDTLPDDDEEIVPRHQITVRLLRNGDAKTDERRLRRIVNVCTKYPGEDHLRVILVENGADTYVMEFPGRTTKWCEGLEKELGKIVTAENVQVNVL